MRLTTLLSDIVSIPQGLDFEVALLASSSKQVTKDSIFFALHGAKADGSDFVAEAIERGASVILQDATASSGQSIDIQNNVPIIPIENLKAKLGPIAAKFNAYPAKKLRMIGVTGTNGKTSCTHFIAQALTARCGIIGTLGKGFFGDLSETGFTTPDAIQLQAVLREFVDDGAQAVAMEVSSHGIDQGRVAGIDFEIGVFTNLTQDHLDYHGTMGAYAKVKHRFLASPDTRKVIINVDDDYGRAWIDELKHDKAVFAYSVKPHAGVDYPLIHAIHFQSSLVGIKAQIVSPWGEGELKIPLLGQFNLSNALAVLTTLCVYGIPFHTALAELSMLMPVPGRMQALGGKGKPLVVVDYSHTPDALEKALSAMRAHTEAELICVFGCGGDRDATKRPLMAKIAERLADKVIVTTDNPRHESPEHIAEQIMGGFKHPERVLKELDRAKAIQNSIQLAKYNDCVLIAGKGAERYQQIGDDRLPFDDLVQAKECLDKY